MKLLSRKYFEPRVHRSSLFFILALIIAMPAGAQIQNPLQPGQLADTVEAPSLTTAEKFHYRLVQAIGPRGFFGPAIGASIAQWNDSPHEWGDGGSGFGKRLASAIGSNISRQTFAFVLETALREDPRYFPSRSTGLGPRVWSTIRQTFYCKKDNGDPSIAYGRLISAFGAGELTSAWQPASNNSVGHGMERGLLTISSDFTYNLLQEFVPLTRPKTIRHHH